MGEPLKIEIHHDRLERPLDITPWVRSVSWTDSLSGPPHQTCSVTVMWTSYMPPVFAGDWVVVRLEDGGPAVHWGMVSGPVATDPTPGRAGRWTFQSIGWFDVLAKADLIVSTMIRAEDEVGTLFTALSGSVLASSASSKGLGALVDAITAGPDGGLQFRNEVGFLNELVSTSYDSAARALALFLRRTPRLALPDSLGGGVLGDSVRTVYDQATAEAYAGPGTAERAGQAGRQVEMIPGSKLVGDLTALTGGSTKVASYAQGTWGVDPALGEMFPSLEDFGALSEDETPDPALQRLRQAAAKTGAESVYGTSTAIARGQAEAAALAPRDPEPFQSRAGRRAGAGTPIPGAASRLGRNPVLVYRMRPWRVTPIDQWANRLVAIDVRFAPVRNAVRRAISNPALVTRFASVTWRPERAAVLRSSDVLAAPMNYGDDALATVFTAPWPGTDSAPVWFRNLGLPLVDGDATGAFGARQYVFNWPFFRSFAGAPTTDTGSARSMLADETVLIVAQGTQFAIDAARFLGGQFEVAGLRPDIRIGEPIRYEPEEPGHALHGYVESTTHTVEIAGDGRKAVEQARTRVVFSRGLWREDLRDFPPPPSTYPPAEETRRRRTGRLDTVPASINDNDRRPRLGIEQ